MGRCSIRTSHSRASFCTAIGSLNPAGKYNTGATFILGSTRLWHSDIERVSVSQAEEMYRRIGLRPSSRPGLEFGAAATWEPSAAPSVTQQKTSVSANPRRPKVWKRWLFIIYEMRLCNLTPAAKSHKMNSMRGEG